MEEEQGVLVQIPILDLLSTRLGHNPLCYMYVCNVLKYVRAENAPGNR